MGRTASEASGEPEVKSFCGTEFEFLCKRSHMKIKNPKLQTTDEMVVSLLSNTNSRLITTVDGFNKKTEKQENLMLAFAQIILALSY